jgi:hypothetical protein
MFRNNEIAGILNFLVVFICKNEGRISVKIGTLWVERHYMNNFCYILLLYTFFSACTLFAYLHWWNRHRFHQYIGETEMFPPIVMKLKTGRTNNHISQIFFYINSTNLLVEDG